MSEVGRRRGVRPVPMRYREFRSRPPAEDPSVKWSDFIGRCSVSIGFTVAALAFGRNCQARKLGINEFQRLTCRLSWNYSCIAPIGPEFMRRVDRQAGNGYEATTPDS